MSKLTTQQIRDLSREVVAQNPGGIRFMQLVEAIFEKHPQTPRNTIVGTVWNLDAQFPSEIAKPSRGLFTPANAPVLPVSKSPEKAGVPEERFYAPFAEWLKNELGEVTESVPLGGAGLKGKWATPDVIGIYRPRAADIVKFAPEVVSAEIKSDPAAGVVAFGQAIAYRLFSWKTYLVMPETIVEADRDRLESLAMLFGVGFVTFTLDPANPKFHARIRAQRFLPDMFYVNEFADRLKQSDPDAFEALFG